MHSTKSEILALLKRTDGATVDDLVTTLGLAPMTVRQHLMALERDALVQTEEVRRATGRPHHRYTLTQDGHRKIAEGYDRLFALLVERAGVVEVNGASPDARRAKLFEAAAQSLAERNRHQLETLPPAGQVEFVAALLRTHGGFAEWHETGEGFELRDFGCVYRDNVRVDGPCHWHDALLANLLGERAVKAESPNDCAACCRYIIPQPARAAAPVQRGSV